MPQREPGVFVIVGVRGCGKSTLIKKILKTLPQKNALVYKQHSNITDAAFLEYPYRRFYDYRGGKARISNLDIKYKPFLKEIAANYTNGALVIDDAAVYERNDPSDELNELLLMCRHMSIDLFLVYHFLSTVPTRALSLASSVILFQTNDNLKTRENRIAKHKELTEMQARINQKANSGNPHYFEILDFMPWRVKK